MLFNFGSDQIVWKVWAGCVAKSRRIFDKSAKALVCS